MNASASTQSGGGFLGRVWMAIGIGSILLVLAVICYPLIEGKIIIPLQAWHRVKDGRELVKAIHAQDADRGQVPRELWPNNDRKIKGGHWRYFPLEEHTFILSCYVGTISRTSVMYRETINPDMNGWFMDYDGGLVPYRGGK